MSPVLSLTLAWLVQDVAFECGRFFYGIRDFAKALRFYTISSETIGQHHVTFHNMGLCYYSLGMADDAVQHFDLSIGMNSNYVKAQSWKEKVEKEIAVRRVKEEAEEVKVEKTETEEEEAS